MEEIRQHRVLLIEPPFHRLFKDTFSLHQFPLSLGYLSGAIKRETDWTVQAYNADFSPSAESPSLLHVVGEGFRAYRENLKSPSAPVWREVKSSIQAFRPTVV